jgi:hypothetical protein
VDDAHMAQVRFSYMERESVSCLEEANLGEKEDDLVEMELNRQYTFQIYLLYLVGIMLFTEKSATYIDMAYIEYFHDLEMIHDFSCGVATLGQFYREHKVASIYKTRQMVGYLVLLQVKQTHCYICNL